MKAEVARATIVLASFARPEHPGLHRFLEALSAALLLRFVDHWHPAEPSRGNGYRCVRFLPHGADAWLLRIISEAGLAAAVLDAFPSELTL